MTVDRWILVGPSVRCTDALCAGIWFVVLWWEKGGREGSFSSFCKFFGYNIIECAIDTFFMHVPPNQRGNG